jgi:hypothetical protein
MADDLNGNVSSLRSGLCASLRVLGGAAAASLVLSLAGCSTFSDSLSESLSKSVSSPFEWSSDSSESVADMAKSYRDDVQNYTEVCSRSSCEAPDIQRGVTAIAEKYGITNWEADRETFAAIGAGLARANMTQPQVDRYRVALAGNDSAGSSALQHGYERGI